MENERHKILRARAHSSRRIAGNSQISEERCLAVICRAHYEAADD